MNPPKNLLASQRTIVFITAEYPFGQQETFVENEIIYLSDAFDQIVVLLKAPRASRERCHLIAALEALMEGFGVSRKQPSWKEWLRIKGHIGKSKVAYRYGKASTNGSHKSKHQQKILQARSPTTAIGLMRERWPQRIQNRERGTNGYKPCPWVGCVSISPPAQVPTL